jgi:G3E family GTPase
MDTVSAQGASQGQGNVAEITGGCFCCRLEELVATIKALDDTTRPDVMIAEPVGSCTDLMATVLQPLEKIYQTPMAFAPLSVVLDARRALAALGGKKNKRSFHRDVGYVYRKQLEEAEWLVVNKIDLLDDDSLEDLKVRLENNFPGKRLFFVSAKTGLGLDEWIEALVTSESGPEAMMEIDYERYAIGEALLGWVNLEGSVTLSEEEAGPWLEKLGTKIAQAMDAGGHEVGHFKMSLEGAGKRWRVHQVMGGEEIELAEDKLAGRETGRMPILRFLVNLRAEGEAEVLQGLVHSALSEISGPKATFSQEAAFQPGKPEPTHRLASL